MSQSTKEKLFLSFKALIVEKPLNKITISNITDNVGVNRHTFYYHFKDEKALMVWGISRRLDEARDEAIRAGNWIDSLDISLHKAEEQRAFLLGLYHSHLRDAFRDLILSWCLEVFDRLIRDQAKGLPIGEQDLLFLINFFSYGLAGFLSDWLDRGMMEDHHTLSSQIRALLGDSFSTALEKFETKHL